MMPLKLEPPAVQALDAAAVQAIALAGAPAEVRDAAVDTALGACVRALARGELGLALAAAAAAARATAVASGREGSLPKLRYVVDALLGWALDAAVPRREALALVEAFAALSPRAWLAEAACAEAVARGLLADVCDAAAAARDDASAQSCAAVARCLAALVARAPFVLEVRPGRRPGAAGAAAPPLGAERCVAALDRCRRCVSDGDAWDDFAHGVGAALVQHAPARDDAWPALFGAAAASVVRAAATAARRLRDDEAAPYPPLPAAARTDARRAGQRTEPPPRAAPRSRGRDAAPKTGRSQRAARVLALVGRYAALVAAAVCDGAAARALVGLAVGGGDGAAYERGLADLGVALGDLRTALHDTGREAPLQQRRPRGPAKPPRGRGRDAVGGAAVAMAAPADALNAARDALDAAHASLGAHFVAAGDFPSFVADVAARDAAGDDADRLQRYEAALEMLGLALRFAAGVGDEHHSCWHALAAARPAPPPRAGGAVPGPPGPPEAAECRRWLAWEAQVRAWCAADRLAPASGDDADRLRARGEGASAVLAACLQAPVLQAALAPGGGGDCGGEALVAQLCAAVDALFAAGAGCPLDLAHGLARLAASRSALAGTAGDGSPGGGADLDGGGGTSDADVEASRRAAVTCAGAAAALARGVAAAAPGDGRAAAELALRAADALGGGDVVATRGRGHVARGAAAAAANEAAAALVTAASRRCALAAVDAAPRPSDAGAVEWASAAEDAARERAASMLLEVFFRKPAALLKLKSENSAQLSAPASAAATDQKFVISLLKKAPPSDADEAAAEPAAVAGRRGDLARRAAAFAVGARFRTRLGSAVETLSAVQAELLGDGDGADAVSLVDALEREIDVVASRPPAAASTPDDVVVLPALSDDDGDDGAAPAARPPWVTSAFFRQNRAVCGRAGDSTLAIPETRRWLSRTVTGCDCTVARDAEARRGKALIGRRRRAEARSMPGKTLIGRRR
ncbi:hypothetical protein M885DRAFT_457720, partial [Pelagophyceae sp. CCMP2097]